MSTRVVVTGGGGFIGAYLVRRLVRDGWDVAVVDTMVRGEAGRLAEVAGDIELFSCDVRDQDALERAFSGAEVVMHLAAINGTENFYKRPELVLDVGLRGALAVVNAGRNAGVPDLVVASSAEVYQTPSVVPTPETIPLMLPDSLNPRYSYGGSKIVSELIAFDYAQDHYRKVQVFRPHNVYGPDMGYKHVIPQFIARARTARDETSQGPARFEIQGDGTQTRAFCYVDDIVDGVLTMYENGATAKFSTSAMTKRCPSGIWPAGWRRRWGSRWRSVRPRMPRAVPRADAPTFRRCGDSAISRSSAWTRG